MFIECLLCVSHHSWSWMYRGQWVYIHVGRSLGAIDVFVSSEKTWSSPHLFSIPTYDTYFCIHTHTRKQWRYVIRINTELGLWKFFMFLKFDVALDFIFRRMNNFSEMQEEELSWKMKLFYKINTWNGTALFTCKSSSTLIFQSWLLRYFVMAKTGTQQGHTYPLRENATWFKTPITSHLRVAWFIRICREYQVSLWDPDGNPEFCPLIYPQWSPSVPAPRHRSGRPRQCEDLDE